MTIANIAKIANIANIIFRHCGICGLARALQGPRNMANPEAERLKRRSRQFALDVIGLVRRFPRSMDAYIVGKQLVKAATSTAANYRAACRGRSPDEFAAKIGVVAEEADESEFWLDITGASGILNDAETRRLLREAGELTAIFTASRDTAKRNLERRKHVTASMLAILAILAIT